jgi:hypothetical protein
MRFLRFLCGAAVLSVSLGCTGEAPVPANPTWVDDVEPILRGNCFHCHGPNRPAAAAFRWDFYDVLDPKLMMIGDFTAAYTEGAGKTNAPTFPIWTGPMTTDQMPPPPATKLDSRDLAVLTAWAKNPIRGVRNPNAKPTAAWLVHGKSIVVSDDDHEQVLGKVTCGGTDTLITASGAVNLAGGSQPPCTGSLYDGQDVVTFTLN